MPAPLTAPEEAEMANDETRTPRPGPDTESAPGERATGADDEAGGQEGIGFDDDFNEEADFDEEQLDDEQPEPE